MIPDNEKNVSISGFSKGLCAQARAPAWSSWYVTFHKNPDDSDPSSGPVSGFSAEGDTEQTLSVLTALPSDGAAYSPLWSVSVYDNAGFDAVLDLPSFEATAEAQVLASDVAVVNCPVVEIEN